MQGFAAATSGQIRAFDVVLSIDGVPVKGERAMRMNAYISACAL
jgi:hypothetical protein